MSVSHNPLCDREAHGRCRRCQQTCRRWSKDCCPSNDIPQATLQWHLASEADPRMEFLHHRLCASYSRRRLCETPREALRPHILCARKKKCIDFHSNVSLRSHFKIHNNNKSFSWMSQSQSIDWVKQKSDNYFQTTKIDLKVFFIFLGLPGTIQTRIMASWIIYNSLYKINK